ncbi:hypothetical protein V6Z77_009924 [Aspergillus fumigatus]
MARSRSVVPAWKARAASPLVACELCAGHFPRQAGALCDWWRTGSPVGPRFRNGAVAHPSRGFYSRAAGAQRPGRVVQAVDGVRSVQQWARP